jgi:hypothetical protein
MCSAAKAGAAVINISKLAAGPFPVVVKNFSLISVKVGLSHWVFVRGPQVLNADKLIILGVDFCRSVNVGTCHDNLL